jgi:hypothetical protein
MNEPIKETCVDCKHYRDEDLPDTIGCGECRRFPPTAIKKCDQPYAMGKYPVIGENNPICYEFENKNGRRLVLC